MLVCHNLGFRYGNKGKVIWEKPIQFTLGADESTVVTGPGKTTFLRILSGQLKPSGRVELFGNDLWKLRARSKERLLRKVGHIRQRSFFLKGMSVAKVLETSFRGQIDERQEAVDDACSQWGLDARADSGCLSGSESRRLEIARVLLGKPELLLADEPLVFLNSFWIERVVQVLELRKEEGKGTIVALCGSPLSQPFLKRDWSTVSLGGEVAAGGELLVFPIGKNREKWSQIKGQNMEKTS